MRVSVAYVLLALSAAGLVAGNLSGLEHKQRARSFGRELKRASGNSDALRAVERAPLLDVFGTDDSKDGKRGSILDGLLGDDSDSDDSSSSTTTHTSTTHSKTSSDDDTSTKSSTKTSDNEDKTTKTSSDDDKTTSTKTSSSDGERQATKTTSDDEPTSTNKGLLGDLVDGVGNLLNPDDDKSTSTTKTTAGPTPAPTANKTKSNDDDDSTSSKTKSSSKDSDEDDDDESTSTSSKDGGLLGGLTSALGGALSDVGGIFTGDGSSTKTSSDDDKSTKTKSKTDDEESTSTTSKGGLLDPILTPILGGGDDDTSTKTGTKTKTNDDESTSTTSKGGLLDPILTPIFGGGDDSSTKTGTKTKSNDDKPSSTSTGGLLDPILTPIFGTGTDEPTKTTTGTKPTQTNDNSDENGSTTNKTGNSGQATRTQSDDSSQATETSGSTSNFDASNVRPTATHLLTDPNATATATDSDDSSRSSDSDRSSTDTETQTTGGYWYADKSSLILPSATSSSDSDDERHDSTKSADPQETNAQQFPATIVPADGALVQPTDTTSVAILLKPTMKWTWLASNSDTTAQVFAFLPAIMSQSVGLDPNDIVTVRLQSYYPTGQTKESDALSLYMAYVPSKSTEDLAAYVRNTSSLFYTGPTDNVAKQLAANVDPNFNILSVVGGQTRGGKAQHETQGNDDSSATLRNALIGVGSALVAVIVGFIGWRVWRKQRKADLAARRAAARPGRRGTIRSFGAGPLRETWAPSIAEQERVLHGQQLTQTWDNDADMQEHDDGPLRRSIIQPGSAGLETGWGDPFVDQWAVGNRSSVMTERSGGSGGLLSRASGLTEAQRIQQEYIDGHEDGVTPLSPTSALAMGGSYNEEYQIPQQYTSSHAYGPRASENQRHRKRTSRSSTASISRPELQSNSMLL